MRIQGIWGDQACQLHPEQWVNVWENTIIGLAFYCTCQVKGLGELATEDYVLELVEIEP
jgi:hypothetical protein